MVHGDVTLYLLDGIGGTMIVVCISILGVLSRVAMRFASLETRVTQLASAISDLSHDPDLIRWSALASMGKSIEIVQKRDDS